MDDLEADVAAALDSTIKTLEALGARVVKVNLPDQTLVSAAALVVLAVEATSYHAPWLRTRAADYGPQVRARLEKRTIESQTVSTEEERFQWPLGFAVLALLLHLGAGPFAAQVRRAAP